MPRIYAATPITGLDADERRLMSLLVWDYIEKFFEGDAPDVYVPIDFYADGEDMQKVFDRNWSYLKTATVILAFNPSTSRGAHFELGYAVGKDVAAWIVNFNCFPIDDAAAMLYGVMTLEGDVGPQRFDHMDDCVLRGSVALPSDRCGCVNQGVQLV